MRKLRVDEVNKNDLICGVERKGEYVGTHVPTLYICPICKSDWIVSPSNIWNGGVRGCRKCNSYGNTLFTEEQASAKDQACNMVRLDPYITSEDKVRYLCSICQKDLLVAPMQVWRGCKGHMTCCRKSTFGKNHHQWGGCEYVSGKYFAQIKRNAKSRKINFDTSLTPKLLDELFIKQNKKCAYSGIDLILHTSTSNKLQEATASLDRINPDKSIGYRLDNIHWVHKDINIMKMDLPDNKFFTWISLIYKYRGLK